MSVSEESLKETGRSQAEVLAEMVAALACDYDRLEELRAERDNAQEDSEEAVVEFLKDNAEELTELETAAGECTSTDDARQRIEEDALSVEVRGDWCSIGAMDELKQPVEFKILLSTGGPATQIRGELSDGEPVRAWLEVQDWGTPWTRYFDISQDTLLAYARVFYFGES